MQWVMVFFSMNYLSLHWYGFDVSFGVLSFNLNRKVTHCDSWGWFRSYRIRSNLDDAFTHLNNQILISFYHVPPESSSGSTGFLLNFLNNAYLLWVLVFTTSKNIKTKTNKKMVYLILCLSLEFIHDQYIKIKQITFKSEIKWVGK